MPALIRESSSLHAVGFEPENTHKPDRSEKHQQYGICWIWCPFGPPTVIFVADVHAFRMAQPLLSCLSASYSSVSDQNHGGSETLAAVIAASMHPATLYEIPPAALTLGVSGTQLVGLFKKCPVGWVGLNRHRAAAGLPALR